MNRQNVLDAMPKANSIPCFSKFCKKLSDRTTIIERPICSELSKSQKNIVPKKVTLTYTKLYQLLDVD